MRRAFSFTKNREVDIDEVFDVNEVFQCTDPNCSAELKIRSINGKRAKHFYCPRGMKKHSPNCTIELSILKLPTEEIKKSSLEDIFENAQIRDNTKSKATPVKSGLKTSEAYVHTPKQLLQFCLGHDVTTTYVDGMTVDDIIINKRNLRKNGRFKGITGLRLLNGNTVNYKESDFSIHFNISCLRRDKRPLILHCTAFVSRELFLKVRNYYINTYQKFGGHPIAVFGKWEIDECYHISCRVDRDRNLIMIFK